MISCDAISSSPLVDGATTKACMCIVHIVHTLGKNSNETISNFQARTRGGLRDRAQSNGTVARKKKVEKVEEIVISHASDIIISSSSLLVKEPAETVVKTSKVPLRKSTLSSGEVILSKIINFTTTSFLILSFLRY